MRVFEQIRSKFRVTSKKNLKKPKETKEHFFAKFLKIKNKAEIF